MPEERNDDVQDQTPIGQSPQSDIEQQWRTPEQSQEASAQSQYASEWTYQDSYAQPQNTPEPPMRSSDEPSPYTQPGVEQPQQYQQYQQPQQFEQPQQFQQPQQFEEPQQPPVSVASIGKTSFKLKGKEILEFQSARNFMIASVIAAVISLIIGGMVVSAGALICALVANSKLSNLSATRSDDPDAQRALKRAGRIAIIVSALAFVLNAIAVIYLYPLIMDSMQTGSFNSLTGSATTPTTGSGSSTWG